jgi:integrase
MAAIRPLTSGRRRQSEKLSLAVTFDGVASEYIERMRRDEKSGATILKLEWMRKHRLQSIGQRPIAEIKPPELLAPLQELEAKGNLETARRVRAFASRVFRFAAATARCENDPAAILRGATLPPRSKPMAAILNSSGWENCYAQSTHTQVQQLCAPLCACSRMLCHVRANSGMLSGPSSISIRRSGAFQRGV